MAESILSESKHMVALYVSVYIYCVHCVYYADVYHMQSVSLRRIIDACKARKC